MIRRVIKIDAGKCAGCALCAETCHEGAIGIVEGKARLLREDHCDGLGNCLPVCPNGAIQFEEREIKAPGGGGLECASPVRSTGDDTAGGGGGRALSHWPVQLKLSPVTARHFDGAALLVSADCCAYAHSSFHRDFAQGRVVLIACPKLDGVDYSDKLSQIISQNDIKSLTVARMEVPCCGGLEYAAAEALKKSGKTLRRETFILSTHGGLA
ncbi:MAG: 4Fe-4S binding protein [Spirochaetaceae bacterium]|jgi:ferredoxin|nr:4Fe-4S binding protein [Spirochaetaceae bacterium]